MRKRDTVAYSVVPKCKCDNAVGQKCPNDCPNRLWLLSFAETVINSFEPSLVKGFKFTVEGKKGAKATFDFSGLFKQDYLNE